MPLPLPVIPYPHIDPVIFHIGPVALRWYGLAYVTGFILAYIVLMRLARRHQLRMPEERVGEMVTWLAVGVIVGGRLGWWLFYHVREPGELWYEVFRTWKGGMSFHGGLVGVLLAAIIWTRTRRMPILNVADCAALVTPIGLFFGRIANFINAELVGRPTNVPWAMIFPDYTQPRHPSQLYEALLEGPVLLALLWLYWRKGRPADGTTAAVFMILYGLFRFVVEFTREPDVQLGFIALGWLTMGQLLSVVLLLAGLVLWVTALLRSPKETA